MKKTLAMATIFVMLIGMFDIQTFAAENYATVYVTISDGTPVMTQESVTVTDIDNDGALTINDALYLAHEAKYTGGASAGYGSAVGQYGLALTKLWGIENGGSYGYYVNNVSAMGLADPIKDGDYINAFVYTDTAGFSDVYCYFDVNTVSVTKVGGSSVSLTLYASGYDENWNPVVKPVEGAIILIGGKESSYVTDANGKVTLELDVAGNTVISAKSSSATLVPPICLISVSDSVVIAPQTGDSIVLFAVMSSAAFASMLIVLRRRNIYEK